MFIFRNKASFYGEELSTPRPTFNLKDHPLSAVRDCLFNIFAATLHIEGRSSIRSLTMPHAMETGTRLSALIIYGRKTNSETVVLKLVKSFQALGLTLMLYRL